MSISIRPGDFFELNCPENTHALVEAGQEFPSAVKEKAWIVVSTDGARTSIGPLRAGQFEINIPCSDGSSVKESITVIAVPSEQLPPRQPPLAPIGFSLPLWFWLALALVVAALIALSFGIKRRRKKPKSDVSKKVGLRPKTGDEILDSFIRKAQSSRWAEISDQQLLSELYTGANDALRAFLEHRLHFKASWATTSEFLGTLKTSLLGYKGLGELSHRVETLLTQADLVRFSKEIPPAQARVSFLEQLKKIQSEVLQATRSESGNMDSTPGKKPGGR